MTALLIAPVAPPATGKSHLVAKLLERGLLEPAAVVCPDALREVFTGDWSDQSENAAVFATAHHMTLARLSHGHHVFFDATNLRPTDREVLAGIADAAGAEVVWVRFPRLSEDGCRARNGGRAREVPAEIMDVMFERYRQVEWGPLPGFVVDDADVAEVLGSRAG